MASNNNGFAEALEDIHTLLRVDKQVSLDVLDEAAEYFASKLKPKIKASDKNKRTHLRDSLKVVIKNDRVSVEFEDKAW
ncbi:phage protein, partial [Bacillus cereus VD133]